MTIAPIKDGKVDEWRAFVALLQGGRRIEWAQSQRRRGIIRQVVSLVHGDPPFAVVCTDAIDIDAAGAKLAASQEPFDVWYCQRIEELHADPFESEVVFDSAPRPGLWRGRR